MRRVLLRVISSLAVSAAGARTWHVPGDAETIQAGIDSAAAGDTVLVTCGIYYEHAISMKSGICLRSETGDPACVTIDAQQQGRVLTCEGVDAGASVEGMTLTGGLLPASERGAGVCCVESDLSIANCIVTRNQAGSGGGLYLSDSSPTISECVISENVGESGGGGIRLTGANPTITDCAIVSNWGMDGGGIFIRHYSAPIITNCIFTDNIAQIWGGAIACHMSSTTMRHCTLVNNEAGQTGGGIWFTYEVSITLENTILAFSHEGGGIHNYPNPTHPSEYAISCCDIFGNAEGNYTGDIDDQTGIGGNISADPLFCDLDADDFTLAANSPCLPGNHPDGADCGLIGAVEQGCGTVGASAIWALPSAPALRAYPNPFTGAVEISYQAIEPAPAITILDVSGRLICTLEPRSTRGVEWDGTSDANHRVAPGTYFVRLEAGGKVEARRVIMLR